MPRIGRRRSQRTLHCDDFRYRKHAGNPGKRQNDDCDDLQQRLAVPDSERSGSNVVLRIISEPVADNKGDAECDITHFSIEVFDDNH